MASLFKMTYYNTYYYANIVDNVINDPFPYLLNLEGFKTRLVVCNFPKPSFLHDFVSFLIEQIMYEDLEDVVTAIELDNRNIRKAKFPINNFLSVHGIEHESFRQWLRGQDIRNSHLIDLIHEYHNDLYLTGPFQDYLERISKEVFYILFQNRSFLEKFNLYLALCLEHGLEESQEPGILTNKGKVKRVYIPEWVKKAVFFRDRGHCCMCQCDLTRTLSMLPKENYDHIVPLAMFGFNDITNIQLLCKHCNSKKRDQYIPVSRLYEEWF